MMAPFWQRLGHPLRNLVPFFGVLILLFLTLIPLHIPAYAVIVPMLPLTAVYYWGLYRSDLLPTIAVFFVGLLQDFLSGAPIGLNAAILLLVYETVVSQRRYLLHESFSIAWASFMVVAAGASALQWAGLSLLAWTPRDPGPGIFQYFLTVALYPCLAWFYAQTQKIILRQA